MADWQNLPMDCLSEIFRFLPRRDRLACSLVCVDWKNALDCALLWSYWVIYVDTDFTDPSTILLSRYYNKYIKQLEIGWAFPQTPSRWMPFKHKDLTKRMVRLLNILSDSVVQIHSLRIFDWYDICGFKKIVYHLARFLSRQENLQKIILNNANLRRSECMRLLTACLPSKSSIYYLDVHNYHYRQTAFETEEFFDFLKKLTCLTVIKMDYCLLNKGVIKAIKESLSENFTKLDVSIRDTDVEGNENEVEVAKKHITDTDWKELKKACPKLRVSFTIRNICKHDHLCLFLKQDVPLAKLFLFTSKIWDQNKSRKFRETILIITRYYQNTLEEINLQLRNNREYLDDVLLTLVKRCPNLKSIDFHGVVHNIYVLTEFYEYLQTHPKLRYFTVLPKIITEESNQVISNMIKFIDKNGEKCRENSEKYFNENSGAKDSLNNFKKDSKTVKNENKFKIINNLRTNSVYIYY